MAWVQCPGSPLVLVQSSFAPGTLPMLELTAVHTPRAFVEPVQLQISSRTAITGDRPKAEELSAAKDSRTLPFGAVIL